LPRPWWRETPGVASSSAVYGDNTDLPASPYGAGKRAAELLLGTYNRLYALDVVALRFGPVAE
jgi:nucleoside-diphosphate-sugar epimerase